RLQLVQDDVAGAAALLGRASQSARRYHFVYQLPEVAAAQVLTLLRRADLAAAAQLAETHDLPLSKARVYLAQGDPYAAQAVLAPRQEQVEAKGWEDERLKVLVLKALALQAQGELDQALRLLLEALALAEPGGFMRLLVDEGASIAQLLSAAAIVAQGRMTDATGYIRKVLAASRAGTQWSEDTLSRPHLPPTPPLIESLSQREVEVLQLIAQGYSNQEIGERLFLALDTVKGHNRKIFGKLQVQRRTEAVARARELGLL